MKKLFTIAVLGLLSTGVFAQTSQGTLVISGTAGFSKTTQDADDAQAIETNTTYFNIAPSLGYMLLDGLEVGVTIGYSYNRNEQLSVDNVNGLDYNIKTHGVNFGVYGKKYFILSERIALTGLASAIFTKGETHTEFHLPQFPASKAEVEVNNYRISLAPGATFFLNEKAGINVSFGSLGYSKFTSNPKGGDNKRTTTQLGLDLNSSTLALGFSYYINR